MSGKDLQRAVKIQIVVNALARGRTVTQACEEAGISRDTWYAWRKNGLVQDVLNTKFKDVTTGVKDLVADSLVDSMRLLTELARGRIPVNTDITGKLAPRDIIAAQKQLIEVWEKFGGDQESREHEQEKILEELRASQISITTVHIETMNVGTEAQPMPVPIGVRPVDTIEGEVEEIDSE